jgi:uncharacterized membrane protein YeiH
MESVRIIEIAGTASFSIAGAFAAMEKKLDLFGIFIIAFVAAMGGGTLRDVLIGQLPVTWMLDLSSGLVVLLSTIAALLFTRVLLNYHKILLLFDSIGLGFFTLSGIQAGVALEFGAVTCVVLGTMTACFGGVIRDISLNNIPLIFEKEIYATTCIAGGVIFFLLKYLNIFQPYIDVTCLVTVVLFRLFAVRYDWQLPSLWNQKKI